MLADRDVSLRYGTLFASISCENTCILTSRTSHAQLFPETCKGPGHRNTRIKGSQKQAFEACFLHHLCLGKPQATLPAQALEEAKLSSTGGPGPKNTRHARVRVHVRNVDDSASSAQRVSQQTSSQVPPVYTYPSMTSSRLGQHSILSFI